MCVSALNRSAEPSAIGRYRGLSGPRADIAEVKRLTHFGSVVCIAAVETIWSLADARSDRCRPMPGCEMPADQLLTSWLEMEDYQLRLILSSFV